MNIPTLHTARQAWKNADATTRAVLEQLFGNEVKYDVTKRILLPRDAFNELGLDYNSPKVTELPEKFARGLEAFHKLNIITAALNEGWTPDWNDTSENKYYPWFAFRGGRFVFSGVGYYYDCTDSDL